MARPVARAPRAGLTRFGFRKGVHRLVLAGALADQHPPRRSPGRSPTPQAGEGRSPRMAATSTGTAIEHTAVMGATTVTGPGAKARNRARGFPPPRPPPAPRAESVLVSLHGNRRYEGRHRGQNDQSDQLRGCSRGQHGPAAGRDASHKIGYPVKNRREECKSGVQIHLSRNRRYGLFQPFS